MEPMELILVGPSHLGEKLWTPNMEGTAHVHSSISQKVRGCPLRLFAFFPRAVFHFERRGGLCRMFGKGPLFLFFIFVHQITPKWDGIRTKGPKMEEYGIE